RVHVLGYLEKAKMARTIWKAVKLDMIITIAPTIWSRLGKLWQKYIIPSVLPRKAVFQRVKRLLFHQLHQWMDIRSIQQMIYQIYGYKLRIATLKYWIIRRKYGREPDDLLLSNPSRLGGRGPGKDFRSHRETAPGTVN